MTNYRVKHDILCGSKFEFLEGKAGIPIMGPDTKQSACQ